MIFTHCEHATDRMTDLLEGALPWPKRLALWGHLMMCEACRGFLRSLRQVPILAHLAFDETSFESAIGCDSLEKALARIRAGEGRVPVLHPEAAAWAALREGKTDLPARLLLETHLGACSACRAMHSDFPAHAPVSAESNTAPPLPEGLLASLPDPKTWKWYRHFLRGARSARLWEDPRTGAGLWLTFVPSGRRFPHHRHSGQEAAVLLAGWIQDGPDQMGPGDFVRHEGGSDHAPVAMGTDGCWILARVGTGGLRFSGWRRIFG